MKLPPVRAALFMLSLGASLVLAGCTKGPPEMEMPPPVVFYKVPEVREVTDYSDFTGRTAAVEAVKVRARVWGYLNEVKFTEGALVKEGEVLFEIDPRTYDTALKQMEARLKLARAQYKLAETEADRNALLRLRGAVSQDDLEKSQTVQATAAASVDSALADVRRAQLDFDFTKVRAPISGQISRTMVTKGNLVESGEMGGTVLTTIVSVSPMYAYFDVDDLTYQQVKGLIRAKEGMSGDAALPPVELGLAAEKGFPHLGRIDFIDNQVDPGTGTLRMRGKFPNEDRVLTPGLFARIHLPLGSSHKAVLITDRAVDTDQGEKVVYVVTKDNVAEKRKVELGKLHDGLREIVKGVSAGDHVVVDGIQRVHGGEPVQAKESTEKDE